MAHPLITVVFPVHPNPNVSKVVRKLLANIDGIRLIGPTDYLTFVHLMKSCHLILTDSGGIQEEGPALGKPVLVLRASTERPEAIESGTVKLVGTQTENIVDSVFNLLTQKNIYESFSSAKNPYGDGQASERILDFVAGALNE